MQSSTRGCSTHSLPASDAYETYCEVCGEPRFTRFDVLGAQVTIGSFCRCERERWLAERASRRAAWERLRVERLVTDAFPDSRMRSWTFANDDGKFGQRQMDVCRRWSDAFTERRNYGGLLLYGPPSGGKTYAACCIANAALDAGRRVMYRSAPSLVGADDDLLRKTAECELLIIDDLGAERDTSYGREGVYRVIEAREESGLDMVVTTNYGQEEFANGADVSSARIYHRVAGCCLPVNFDTGRTRANDGRYARMRKALVL